MKNNIPVNVAIVCYNEFYQVACTARRHNHVLWGLPGGSLEFIDGDVTNDLALVLRRAAVRELREETGLFADINNLKHIYTGVCRDESGGSHPDSMTTTFLAEKWQGVLCTQQGEPPASWQSWNTLFNSGAFADYNQRVFESFSKLLQSANQG